MATFKALISGLSLSARDIITEALTQSFGNDVVDLISLNKENLRQSVRLSLRDVQTVLVVLDKVSTDLCKGIENGLYSSDKFFSYTSDVDLVNFLNNKFSINLPIPEESELEVSEDVKEETIPNVEMEEVIKGYQNQIQDQSMLIQNLNNRISELLLKIEKLETFSEDEEKTKKIESLHNQIIELSNDLQKVSSEKEELLKSEETLSKTYEDLKKRFSVLETMHKDLTSEYSSLNEELTKEHLQNSSMSGVIRSLEKKVEDLQKEKNSLLAQVEQVKTLTDENESLEAKLSTLQTKISNLNSDIDSKSRTIDRLKRELDSKGNVSQTIDDLKADLDSLQLEKDALEKSNHEYQQEVQNLQKQSEESSDLAADLQLQIDEYKTRAESDSESLTQLNQERIQLLAKIDKLEKSTDRNMTVEELMSELNVLRKDYSNMKEGVFGKIASYAMPRSSSPIFLTRKGVSLRNTRFTFAGSTESRKGAYKCLLNELKGYSGSDRFLIVDVVSETSIDYVFEIKKMISGIEWFRKGGGVQQYLSSTCLKNVQVLSPGLSYCNEAYFLTVNWEQRLTELENSGYKVIVFFGDISNLCGRIFHESFADLGDSYIYVHGNAIGSRTIVSNLKGLSNGKSSIIVYFDFNTQVKRFYDMVAKTNECRVLSVLRGK